MGQRLFSPVAAGELPGLSSDFMCHIHSGEIMSLHIFRPDSDLRRILFVDPQKERKFVQPFFSLFDGDFEVVAVVLYQILIASGTK